VLSLAGADPRDLDLVAFGGMGAVHATTQAAALGMRRVLVPKAAPGFSALGLLTADHVADDTRTLISAWSAVDLDQLNALADDLEGALRGELRTAGVSDDRTRLEWSLNLVYPGQTFDNALPLDLTSGGPITMDHVRASVETFHRRNEEARLIEARAQEPSIRGLRLTAIGLVDQPEILDLTPSAEPAAPVGHRRLYAGGAWHAAASVFDGDALHPGQSIEGPAAVQFRFTTLILRSGDRATLRSNGDTLVDVATAVE
jgi:N-methylhydantoinase A